MQRRTLIVGLVAFLLVGIVVAGAIVFSQPAEFRGTFYVEPYPAAYEIELTRSNGDNFHLNDLRGNIVLIFFGYTSCPDVCPTTLAELNLALEELNAAQAEQVKVVFVTVDPERDTPAHVQEYVNHFNTQFIGLSGTEIELAKVWNGYGVFRSIVDNGSATGYLVDHTARVTLVDQQGNIRVSFAFDTPVEDIVHDLKLLLK